MNEQAIQEQYQHIVTLLKQQRLKEAQSQLEAFLWNSGDWTLRNRLEQAQTSYQYMLQYIRQGIDDPERQKLYRQILTETWEVADQARLSLLDGVSTHYYHSLRNNRERLPKEYNIAALQKVLESFPDDLAVCQLMPDNQGMDAVLQRHEQTAQVLFLSTWSNSDWSAEDEQQAKGLLESEMLPVNDLCRHAQSDGMLRYPQILMVARRRNACKYASKPTGFGRYRFRTSFSSHPSVALSRIDSPPFPAQRRRQFRQATEPYLHRAAP